MVVLGLAATILFFLTRTIPQDALTAEERLWVTQHPHIRLAPDPNFPPLESFDENNQFVGVIADIYKLIEQRLDVTFEFVQLPTWDDVIQKAKNRQIDGITAAQITPERAQYLLYSQPIIDIPNVIITQKNIPNNDLTFDMMDGQTLAVTRGNAFDEYIRNKYPKIKLVAVDDDLTALREVSFGRVDATIVNMAIASHLIEKHGITNLKVAGDSGRSNVLAIAIRNDTPILNSIMKKGLALVTKQEKEDIYRRWVTLGGMPFAFTQEILRVIAFVMVVIALGLGLIVAWNLALRRQVRLHTKNLEKELAERNLAEQRIQRQLEQLSALRTIDTAITASLDLHLILNILIQQVIQQLKVDASAILLFNPRIQRLDFAVGTGVSNSKTFASQVILSDNLAGKVAFERHVLIIPDLGQADSSPRVKSFLDEGFVAYYGIPLIAKGQIKGVMEILLRHYEEPDREWLDFLQTLASQAAIAIDNTELFENLERSNTELIQAYEATLEGWSKALDLRDHETQGHSERVTDMTLYIARQLGVNEEELGHIRRGALLHDIGKMGIPDDILLKPGPLQPEEWTIMRQHPEFAYDLLHPISFLQDAIPIPYCHHERWDGSGYPRGLKGDAIPLAARIFAVVDVWDALLSNRPYRPSWSEKATLDYIRENSGKLFDPEVVSTFFEVLNENKRTPVKQ